MKDKKSLKKSQSSINITTSIVTVLIAILLLVFLIYSNHEIFSYTYQTSEGSTFTYRALRSNQNVLCRNHNAHLSNYTWKLTNKETHTNVTDTAAAYIFAYSKTNGRGNGTDQYYGDYVQQAYWHLCNSKTGKANNLYKEAIAYANYRKNYQELKITNLTRKSSHSISFKITGSHNDQYGFGKITKVTIHCSNGKDIEGKKQYGTQTVDLNQDCNSVRVEVEYAAVEASANYSTYKTKRGNSNQYVGQPIVIFTGKISGGNKTTSEPPEKEPPFLLSTDVSMQKYITRVNDEDLTESETTLTSRKNKISSSSASTRAKANPSPEFQNGKELKSDNKVKIDKGDSVTYQIEIYNNTEFETEVTLQDKFLYYSNTNYKNYTIKKITFHDLDINSKYSNWNNWGSGITKKCSFKIAGNTTGTITITVQFNDEMNTHAILNSASISSPNNKTKYRTYDTDYVKMNAYKVQLKKYVSKVASSTGEITKYTNDEAKENQTNYPYITDWIAEHFDTSINKTFSNLKNQCAKIERNTLNDIIHLTDVDISKIEKIDSVWLRNWKKMDINQDNTISQEDIEMLHNLNLSSKYNKNDLNEINHYIQSDINGDGKVNEEDQYLYQAIISDLNSDGSLDEKDIYYLMSLCSNVNNDHEINVEDLYIIKSMIAKNNGNLEQQIQDYMKSDIDDDGIVTSNKDFFDSTGENENNITDEQLQELYNSQNRTISNPTENLKDAQQCLQQYDINHDQSFNIDDYNDLESYVNKYKNLYKKYKDNKYDDPETNENIYKELSDYFIDKAPDDKGDYPFEKKYDFNDDEKVNSDDLYDCYEVMTYGKNIDQLTTITKEQYNEIMSLLDINQDEVLDVIDISFLKIAAGEKEYHSNIQYSTILDINCDRLINEEDIKKYTDYKNNNYTILSTESNFVEYFESFIQTYKIDLNNIDENYYDLNQDHVLDTQDIKRLEKNIQEINTYLENHNLTFVNYEGTNKVFNPEMNNENYFIKYDLNSDSKVDENDYYELSDLLSYQGYQNVNSYTEDEINRFINSADLDGDRRSNTRRNHDYYKLYKEY